jgi:ornithine cyclodeaminase
MSDGSILVVSAGRIKASLQGQDAQIIEVIKSAYLAHAAGSTILPHSLFLRFPDSPNNRIIALPGFIQARRKIVGLKWIASFPSNCEQGRDRASAVLILNSAESGVPEAILEGSIISAKRTGASAALAAQYLSAGRHYESLGVIGCGYINYEICRFLASTCPGISRIVLFDKDYKKSRRLAASYAEVYGTAQEHVANNAEELLATCDLISFATTSSQPYIDDLTMRPGSTVLHISLRDLDVSAVLAGDNVVDDADHVCRAQTSLHLAEQHTGSRNFIRCSLGDVLNGTCAPRGREAVTIFSPFGLGILDLALGDLVLSLMGNDGQGVRVPTFLPEPWDKELKPEPAA